MESQLQHTTKMILQFFYEPEFIKWSLNPNAPLAGQTLSA